jgi:plastocyanin
MTMNRRHTFLLIAVTLAIGGCGGASTTTSATSPSAISPTTPPSSGVAPVRSPASSLVATPFATLASTTERSSQAPAGAVTIKMTTLLNAAPRFEPDHITAKAGTAVFFLANVPRGPFAPDHNMLIGPAIHRAIARTPTIRADETMTFTVNDLTPGTYVFWCSIVDPGSPDHASEGMVGTLTITP